MAEKQQKKKKGRSVQELLGIEPLPSTALQWANMSCSFIS